MTPHTLGAVELPGDVWWADEFDWSPIEQAQEYSVTGALIIDEATKQAGRQITLRSADGGGWVPRATVQALQAMRDDIGETYLLSLADGRSFTVRFDLTRPFEAAPVRPACDMTGATPYTITIPLIEV